VSRYGIPENEPEPHDISALDLAHRLVNTDIESPTVMVIGPRRSGKSFYVKWLLYHMTALGKEYDLVMLFSGGGGGGGGGVVFKRQSVGMLVKL